MIQTLNPVHDIEAVKREILGELKQFGPRLYQALVDIPALKSSSYLIHDALYQLHDAGCITPTSMAGFAMWHYIKDLEGEYVANSGWIAVDLDGTLAVYDGKSIGYDELGIGPPVPAMVERVKTWLAAGRDVRIFTARVGVFENATPGYLEQVAEQRRRVELWCERHIGRKLKVTAMKDFGMAELYDDRAIQVEPNTGRLIG